MSDALDSSSKRPSTIMTVGRSAAAAWNTDMTAWVADRLVTSLQPRSALILGSDGAGLQQALRRRGISDCELVEVTGAVIDTAPRHAASAQDARYDIVVCLDALDGLSGDDARRLAASMAKQSEAMLFSTVAARHPEQGPHIDGRPALIDWLETFREIGFDPDVLFDPSFVAPHAVLLRRRQGGRQGSPLTSMVEVVRQRVLIDRMGSEGWAVSDATGSSSPRATGELRQSREDLLRGSRALLRRCAELETAAQESSAEATILRKEAASQARELAKARLMVSPTIMRALHPERGPRPSLLNLLGDALSPRRKRRVRQRRRLAEFLSRSGFVDQDWYTQRYPSIDLKNSNAARHYVDHGAAELRNPSGLFSTGRYVAAYPDVRSSGLNPLLHYLTIGLRQGRNAFAMEPDRTLIATAPWFDSAWYLETYPDVAAAGIDPALHYLEAGAREGRDPGPLFSTSGYVGENPDARRSGLNPLIHFLEIGHPEGRLSRPTEPRVPAKIVPRETLPNATTATALVEERFPHCRPLTVFAGVEDQPRLTILTDSINAGSLFGGVATALIFGTLLADRWGATLRIVTRTEVAEAENVAAVLDAHGIRERPNIEFAFAPVVGNDPGFEFNAQETLLTTSWWGTRAALAAIAPDRIIYLIQEDERMFYAQGDEHLLCSETLNVAGVRYIVNSELLFKFFEGQELRNLVRSNMYFEPAFPRKSYYREHSTISGPNRLFFYARPINQRNLFYRGLSVVNEALTRGVIDPAQWEIHFAGNTIPDLVLAGGVRPIVHPLMSWDEYGRFIRTIDLGISLMYTPHPSYPPLDIAASGGVALTNRFANKIDLSVYSDNIMCVGSDLDSLVAGLEPAVELALDAKRRQANYEGMRLNREWAPALEPVLARLVR